MEIGPGTLFNSSQNFQDTNGAIIRRECHSFDLNNTGTTRLAFKIYPMTDQNGYFQCCPKSQFIDPNCRINVEIISSQVREILVIYENAIGKQDIAECFQPNTHVHQFTKVFDNPFQMAQYIEQGPSRRNFVNSLVNYFS